MLTFFPRMYPQELLYSILARYHDRSGNINYKTTMNDLFGSMTVCATVELPSGIEELVKNQPVCSQITAADLVHQHTLFPLYSAFLPPDQAHMVYASMLKLDGKDIYNRVGLMASSIKSNTKFKFCPLCSIEMLQTYGEMYWNRVFQVPGMVCVKHGTWLEDSNVMMKLHNKHVFVAANAINCSLETIGYISSTDILNKYRLFVNDIEKLLENNYPKRDLKWFYRRYHERLKIVGLANVKGRVYHRELKKSFVNFYGTEFLDLLQSNVPAEGGWLSDIVRKHRKSFHPIRHLLLMRFLGMTLDELFYGEEFYQPFGESPFPCLNVCCKYYRKDVIPEVNLNLDEKTKKPIGTFCCSACGFAYTRNASEQSGEDRFKISRVKQYGDQWEKEVQKLVRQGVSFRQIAKKVNADVGTVIKYTRKNEAVTYPLKKNQDSTSPDYFRDSWLQLQKKHPDLSKTELRKLLPRVYAWLYRNDRAFLDRCSPKTKRSPAVQRRIDWEARDEDILGRVQEEVHRLNEQEGLPEKITISKIGASIGCRNLLEKHLNKLPLTKVYLETAIDTPDLFKVRRIRWAITELLRDGEALADWKIYRKASIRPCNDTDLDVLIKSVKSEKYTD
ncbi:TnsD family transposase [Brevibacillus borstelensis]|uniref:TnsD family transposase n=1 Tax=Brevibacillus borstelensis TaxID=45462 RepID=UPI00203FFD53|nr:TnsD family transposase [Brevibacillus borstelensis]MCM3623681.1 TnsD family transposase [Brevibacillus borstelensis]